MALRTDQDKINRRGCFMLAALVLLALALLLFLAGRAGDRQQADEALSEGVSGNR